MRFEETELRDVVTIEPDQHVDERGSFARIWCRDELRAAGLLAEVAQCSISRNTRTGTLRGLHFQRPPHEEAKIVRCTRGAIFDVAVDVRPSSPTRGRWVGVRLDAEEGRALYLPKGVAHGFQTLVDDSEVLYLISTEYVPGAVSGVRWDDPTLAIDWPEVEVRTISERDRALPLFGSSP